jgi:hypothetical protein
MGWAPPIKAQVKDPTGGDQFQHLPVRIGVPCCRFISEASFIRGSTWMHAFAMHPSRTEGDIGLVVGNPVCRHRKGNLSEPSTTNRIVNWLMTSLLGQMRGFSAVSARCHACHCHGGASCLRPAPLPCLPLGRALHEAIGATAGSAWDTPEETNPTNTARSRLPACARFRSVRTLRPGSAGYPVVAVHGADRRHAEDFSCWID